jgi:hypothetical protein
LLMLLSGTATKVLLQKLMLGLPNMSIEAI